MKSLSALVSLHCAVGRTMIKRAKFLHKLADKAERMSPAICDAEAVQSLASLARHSAPKPTR
jgi:hypothetical protein